MPSTDPTAATDRREFRTRCPWGLLLVWWPLAAVVLWCYAQTALMILLSRYPLFAEMSEETPAWLSAVTEARVVAFCIAVASLLVLAAARTYLLDARRALILVARDSIVITDRRRRTRDIPWGEVHELRLHRWEGPTFASALRLKTPTGIVRIPDLIAEHQLLAKEIIIRAGLTEVQRGRFRFTYRRAQTPT